MQERTEEKNQHLALMVSLTASVASRNMRFIGSMAVLLVKRITENPAPPCALHHSLCDILTP